MGKIKTWAANLFWSVAGNALWTWLAGGVLIAGATTVLSWFRALNPMWLDRGITTLAVLVVVMGGSAIQTLFKRRRAAKEPPSPPEPTELVLPLARTAASKKWLYTPLKEIYRRTYRNEPVPLDGSCFVDCIFDEGTEFRWNGTAMFKMINPQPTAKWYWKFTTDNLILHHFITFLMDTKQIQGTLDRPPPPPTG
jgi:hypothetical protein